MTYLANLATNTNVSTGVDTHILHGKAQPLDVPIKLEMTGGVQGPVQTGGIGRHGDQVWANVPTQTVRSVVGMIGWPHGNLTAGKGAIGDAATSQTAGYGHDGLPVVWEAGDVGDVGTVAAEAVGGVEDRRLQDRCLAYGVEGPIPVSDGVSLAHSPAVWCVFRTKGRMTYGMVPV